MTIDQAKEFALWARGQGIVRMEFDGLKVEFSQRALLQQPQGAEEPQPEADRHGQTDLVFGYDPDLLLASAG